MSHLLIHSKEHVDLAFAEIDALFSQKATHKEYFSIIKKASLTLLQRLAYTKSAMKIIWSGTPLQFLKKEFSISKYVKKSYSIATHNLPKKLKKNDVLAHLTKNLTKKRVSISQPQTQLFVVGVGKNVILAKQIFLNSEDFNERKNHYRKKSLPISIHPKLARAMINLTGIKKGILFDPLCGTGGFLIEAGLMNISYRGSDINEKMIEYSKLNLTSFKLPQKQIQKKDVFLVKKKYSYIVTDPPYGINTKLQSNTFYEQLIKKLAKLTTKRLVIGFPHWFHPMKHFKKEGMHVEKSFEYYIHKSLTKNIFILRKC